VHAKKSDSPGGETPKPINGKELAISGADPSYATNKPQIRHPRILPQTGKIVAQPVQIWYKALLSSTYSSKREIEMLGFTGFS
jgi:hypothetical protein